MELIEYDNGFGNKRLIVMDGKRLVAHARPIRAVAGLWLMTFKDGCWTDPRAGVTHVTTARYRNLLAVTSKREAKKIMKELCNQGAKFRKVDA